MSKPFRVSDRVTWCGVEGVVESIDWTTEFSLLVNFDLGGGETRSVSFTKDGIMLDWHKEPSLFHVEDKVEKPQHGKQIWKDPVDHSAYNIPLEPYHPTRREYFAAAALTGLFSNGGAFNFIGSYEDAAIRTADKMIELLDAKEEK